MVCISNIFLFQKIYRLSYIFFIAIMYCQNTEIVDTLFYTVNFIFEITNTFEAIEMLFKVIFYYTIWCEGMFWEKAFHIFL